MPNAAAIASVPLPPTAPASCANAAGANSATDASATINIAAFFITASLKLPPVGGSRPCALQPVSRWSGKPEIVSVLFSYGLPDINRRQHGEDISLDDRHEYMQADKENRDQYRKDAQDHAQHRTLRPTPLRRPDQQAEKDYVDQVAGEDVGPETNGEREDARRCADHLH